MHISIVMLIFPLFSKTFQGGANISGNLSQGAPHCGRKPAVVQISCYFMTSPTKTSVVQNEQRKTADSINLRLDS